MDSFLLDRCRALQSVIVYPQTSTLQDTATIAQHEHNNDIRWTDVMKSIERDPELISLRAQEDVHEIFSLVRLLFDELYLFQFDAVVCCRSGVKLFALVNTHRKVNRSALIEINDYHHVLSQQPPINGPYWPSLLLVSVIITGVLILLHARKN